MVQPALPLILGLRPQKAKPVAVEPEPEAQVVDSEPAPQLHADGGVTDTETQSVVEASSADALEYGISLRKEGSPVAGQYT
jgi:hypothetical protein